ncbi:MAG: sulfur carrier protein ThiS [Solidesulfovibrio sp.]|uniref:sulfur carrier protein ThiS n=1 Tax=Solidesulfovibrio sp. TaxID=2910990 RepID=UPI003158C217
MESGTILASYLEKAGLPKSGLVVEQNGTILPPAAWASTVLAQADRIEIIPFVAGGG